MNPVRVNDRRFATIGAEAPAAAEDGLTMRKAVP
jgi:hypothetical protein